MILGVTGGIAAGKSTVVETFARLGVPVVCADQLAREVVMPGSPLLSDLVAAFGADILAADGTLQRQLLAERTLGDEAQRQRLNHLMHPPIARLATERLAAAKRSAAPFVIYDAALLFESGAYRKVDRILVVTADDPLRLKRLMDRNGYGPAEARDRMRAQRGVDSMAARADYIIDNSGTLQALYRQVVLLYDELSALAAAGKKTD